MLKQTRIDEIVELLWFIPLEKLSEVNQCVRSLKDRHGYEKPTDDSDEWSDEDTREFTQSSMNRLDEQDPWPQEE